MPVSVEVKYEYFNTWAGRIKIIEVVSADKSLTPFNQYLYSINLLA